MGKKFKGIGCPCITPFDDEEKIDLIALREMVDFQINSEINAIITTSSSGESYSLSDEEFKQIIDTTIDQVNDAVPVYVGLPTESSQRARTLATFAIDAGADGFVLYPPKLTNITESELITYYEFLCSKIDQNILFVNEPDQCGIDFDVEVIKQISKFDDIVGMIELSNDFKKISQISNEVSDDFCVYTGRGILFPQSLTEAKVEGAILPSANIAPNLLVELYETFKVEMKERFEEIQSKLIPLEIGLKLRSYPSTLKAALKILGVQVGNPRAPLHPLPENDVDKLRNILISAGLLRPPATEESEKEEEKSELEEKEKKKSK